MKIHLTHLSDSKLLGGSDFFFLSALAVRKEHVFHWFWIGPHDEYERILKG